MSAVVRRATDILARNAKGHFLMAEWNLHADDVKAGLEHTLTIRETTERLNLNSEVKEIHLFI